MKTKISPCLWLNSDAEEAAHFYTRIFRDSKITNVSRYGEEGKDVHGKEPGSAMAVEFELNGQSFTALNGGPMFKFSEAISLVIECDSQDEVDHYWDRLSEGSDATAQQCGWLKDKYGLSWQVVPKILAELLRSPDKDKSERTFRAMLQMTKFDIATLQRASEE